MGLSLAGRPESNVLSTVVYVWSDGDEMRGSLDAGIDNIPARFRFPVIQLQGRRSEHQEMALDRRDPTRW